MKRIKVRISERVRSGHLWIFSNEVSSDLAGYGAGELVEICGSRGEVAGTGYVNPRSLIALRILCRDSHAVIDRNFFQNRIDAALRYRRGRGFSEKDSCRLVYGESDGLPGLIIDRYAGCLSVQILTAGMENLFPIVKDLLIEMFRPAAIILRNTSPFRKIEGLPLYNGLCYGSLDNEPIIDEQGVLYSVDMLEGQKTGFFLDQRDNRLFARTLSFGGQPFSLLDCFSYSGGWALSAGYNKDCRITCVDLSEKSIQLIQRNAFLNRRQIDAVRADVFDYLRAAQERLEKFDLIILDPPAFIKSRSKVKEGMKGYREINARAMKLLRPNGVLVTSSCSHHIDRDSFTDLLRECASDARQHFRILHHGCQAQDHPVLLAMPETEYLKTLFLQTTG